MDDEGRCLLRWAWVFLAVTVMAGILAFGGVQSASSEIAAVLFFVFMVVTVVSFVMSLVKRR